MKSKLSLTICFLLISVTCLQLLEWMLYNATKNSFDKTKRIIQGNDFVICNENIYPKEYFGSSQYCPINTSDIQRAMYDLVIGTTKESMNHSNIVYNVAEYTGIYKKLGIDMPRVLIVTMTSEKMSLSNENQYNLVDQINKEKLGHCGMDLLTINLPDTYRTRPSNVSKTNAKRSVKCIEEIYLMEYSHTFGKQYLHLAGVTGLDLGKIYKVWSYVSQQDGPWFIIHFGQELSLFGGLLKSEDVKLLIPYFLANPHALDAVLESFLQLHFPRCKLGDFTEASELCFYHANMVQLATDHSLFFMEKKYLDTTKLHTIKQTALFFQNKISASNEGIMKLNPVANIMSSFKEGTKQELTKTYKFQGHTVLSNVQQGDFIAVEFLQWIQLESYFIRIMSKDCRGLNIHVDLLPVSPYGVYLEDKRKYKYNFLEDGYIYVGTVNERCIAEGPIGSNVGWVTGIRIRFLRNHNTQILVKDLVFKLLTGVNNS